MPPTDSCLTSRGRYPASILSEASLPNANPVIVLMDSFLTELEQTFLSLEPEESHFSTAASEPSVDFSDLSRRITGGGGNASRRLGPSVTLTL
jgi:hypothetical protein